jgi:hypothetical protein
MLLACPGKEPFGRHDVALFAQENIDGAALVLDRAAQVDPLTPDREVGEREIFGGSGCFLGRLPFRAERRVPAPPTTPHPESVLSSANLPSRQGSFRGFVRPIFYSFKN